ncbi:MerR family transcriptional regulator [Catenulispora subtropica]|uniref:Helix-turn-helix domain-containing protein n=1 Tax=Catenulispora subtropica TaxID=450798 RepID=A0ABN2T2Y3_9ACTN
MTETIDATTTAALLDIGDVAARTGLAPSALRFYEQRGLIEPAGRNGLRRTYQPEVLDRLSLIACARQAGFGIAEISRFLMAGPGDTELRQRMAAKADELDVMIARLTRMRAALRHGATCPRERLVDCPEFMAAVKEA